MSWTPERIKQLKRELQQGKKTAEIAKDLGVSKTSVASEMKRLNLKEKVKSTKTSGEKAPVKRKIPKEGIGFLELKVTSCRWPMGEITDDHMLFCGQEAVPGKPYCAKHCAIAYSNSKEAKAEMLKLESEVEIQKLSELNTTSTLETDLEEDIPTTDPKKKEEKKTEVFDKKEEKGNAKKVEKKEIEQKSVKTTAKETVKKTDVKKVGTKTPVKKTESSSKKTVPVSQAKKAPVKKVVASPQAKKAPAKKVVSSPQAKKAPAKKVVASPQAKKMPAKKVIAPPQAKKTSAKKVVASSQAKKMPAKKVVASSQAKKTLAKKGAVTPPKKTPTKKVPTAKTGTVQKTGNPAKKTVSQKKIAPVKQSAVGRLFSKLTRKK